MVPAEISLNYWEIEENPCCSVMMSGEWGSARTRGSRHVHRKEEVQGFWQYVLLRLL